MLNFHEDKLKQINKNLVIDKQFSGGMSNFTYLCKDIKNNDKYVFRVPGDGSEIFVDFKREKYNLEQIKDLNITSKVIYIDEEGYKLSQYIEGDIAVENTDYKKVADLLKKLHNSNTEFESDYDHLGRLEKYENIRKTPLSEQYISLRNEFIEIFNTKLKHHINKPCHSDAQIANIIREENTNNYYLIDWEFAATGDVVYDIASFGNRDFNDAEKLITYYFNNPTKDEYKRLYAWRMFQALQWHNVAQYKHEIKLGKKLGLDFEVIAQNYLKLAKEMCNNYIS